MLCTLEELEGCTVLLSMLEIMERACHVLELLDVLFHVLEVVEGV